MNISIILPAKNEADSLRELLPRLRNLYPNLEIIVVNDGSTDDTALLENEFDITVITHKHSLGNGAAIKSGQG